MYNVVTVSNSYTLNLDTRTQAHCAGGINRRLLDLLYSSAYCSFTCVCGSWRTINNSIS